MSKQPLNSNRIKAAAGSRKPPIVEEHVKTSIAVADKLPGLSRRESEVLSWVAHGKTNSEVATILGISRRTVDTLLSRTYQKLGVETRLAAVMMMLKFIDLSLIYVAANLCSDLDFFLD